MENMKHTAWTWLLIVTVGHVIDKIDSIHARFTSPGQQGDV